MHEQESLDNKAKRCTLRVNNLFSDEAALKEYLSRLRDAHRRRQRQYKRANERIAALLAGARDDQAKADMEYVIAYYALLGKMQDDKRVSQLQRLAFINAAQMTMSTVVGPLRHKK